MAIPQNPAIFHITHERNLATIIADGGLSSDAVCRARSLTKVGAGYSHIKDRRLRRPVPVAAKGMLGEYVPFYFCPRSVMLYVLHRGHEGYQEGQEPMVHLVSDVRTATGLGRPWAFTDRHAELAYARYFDALGSLTEVDWNVMPPEVWWGGDDEKKERRQAEFLVHEFFEWTAISRIYVFDDAVRSRINLLVDRSPHQPAVIVRKDWYY